MAYLWKRGRHRPCEYCPFLAQSFPFFIMFMVRKLFIPSFLYSCLRFSSIHSPLSRILPSLIILISIDPVSCSLPFLSPSLRPFLLSFPSPLFSPFLLSSFPFLPFLPFLLFFFSFLPSFLLSTLPFLRVLPSPWLFPHPLFLPPFSLSPLLPCLIFPFLLALSFILFPSFPFLSFPIL